MSLTVFLDAGPLGLITNPKRTPDAIAATQWGIAMMAAGHRFIVPAIADFEVRRELIRAGKTKGLISLDVWNRARTGRYLTLTDSALRLGASLWARARNAGKCTADPKELDGDVLIGAQALDTGLPASEYVIATTNVGHLAQFAPADLWTNIRP
jgi:predicted nucleic acid-binding protein